jgi:hypothetical protein
MHRSDVAPHRQEGWCGNFVFRPGERTQPNTELKELSRKKEKQKWLKEQ